MAGLTDEELKFYGTHNDAGWIQRELATECIAHRATMKRLEEWATELEGKGRGTIDRRVAADLRQRMKGE